MRKNRDLSQCGRVALTRLGSVCAGGFLSLFLTLPILSEPGPVDRPADAEPVELAEEDRSEPGSISDRVRTLLNPEATRLPGEAQVVRSDQITPACGTEAGREAVIDWLESTGVAVLDAEGPGLVLNYFAEGIEAMTPADRVWEGLPKRAESMQMLIDDAITRSRRSGRPIDKLVIIGHAGLPGCAAFGGTLEDCVFKGKLSNYQRQQLVRLRPYLGQGSEIELRQCVTGSGKEGQRLLQAIHELTAAAVTSYLADFHFGDSAAHPRIRVDGDGVRLMSAVEK